MSETHNLSYLLQQYKHRESSFKTLLILNQPIPSLEILKRLFKSSGNIIAVDGGANRLFDFLNEVGCVLNEYMPNSICGDLDSIRPEVLSFYKEAGVKIMKDPDQYSTDFGKAMKTVRKKRDDSQNVAEKMTVENVELSQSQRYEMAMSPKHDIMILGGISGRVDQGLGLLSEMQREQRRSSSAQLYLVSERSISFILGMDIDKKSNTDNWSTIWLPDANKYVPKRILDEGREETLSLASDLFTPNVGIIPLFGPTYISTQGLEWDVEDWYTEMGRNVSTSNHVLNLESGDVTVKVKTEKEVLFTIELGPALTQTSS